MKAAELIIGEKRDLEKTIMEAIALFEEKTGLIINACGLQFISHETKVERVITRAVKVSFEYPYTDNN